MVVLMAVQCIIYHIQNHSCQLEACLFFEINSIAYFSLTIKHWHRQFLKHDTHKWVVFQEQNKSLNQFDYPVAIRSLSIGA